MTDQAVIERAVAAVEPHGAGGPPPRLVLIVPHGMAARNFLLSGALELMAGSARVTVVSPFAGALRELLGAEAEAVELLPAPPFSEGKLGYLLRDTAKIAHLRVFDTVGMRHILEHNRPRGRVSPTRLARSASWHLSRLVRGPDDLRRLSRAYQHVQAGRPATAAYRRLLEQTGADVVLCCDQRPPETAALVAAARMLAVPVGTFLFSWDNLSSKGRMPGDFDFYCVWSRFMKQELLRFYPHVSEWQVDVTGTPQFEPHLDSRLAWSRAVFCDRVGADHDRPILCFSGEVAATDPENPAHLAALCEAIESGLVNGDPQVLVRPAPTDDEDRWSEVRGRYPWLLWCPPEWRRPPGAGWMDVLPTRDDVAMLANIARHCACGINVCSTMTIDFAIAGKPTINLAFDVAHPPIQGVPVWEKLFRFEHYVPVVELGGALVARTRHDLATLLNRALDDPDVNLCGREELLRLELDDSLGRVGGNLARILTARARTSRGDRQPRAGAS